MEWEKCCQRQKRQGQRVGRKGAAKRAALSREQSVSQQSDFYIYMHIYYRVQQCPEDYNRRNLFTPTLCVFYQSGSKVSLLPDIGTPCKKQLWCFFFPLFLNILHVIYFFLKRAQATYRLSKGLPLQATFFQLLNLIHHLSICELVSLSYQTYSFI